MKKLELRVDEKIKTQEVCLIDTNGENLGRKNIQDALFYAKKQGLNLVEIAPQAKPPVCRVLDYGKFKYSKQQKEKKNKKKPIETKEVKFKSGISNNDLDIKVSKINKFLESKNKVKFQIILKKHQKRHPELADELFEKIVERIETNFKIESKQKLPNSNMVGVIASA